MTDRTTRPPDYRAAQGGMTVSAVRGSGYLVFAFDVPGEGDRFEVMFPVDHVEELVEDLTAAAAKARERTLRAVD